VLKLEAKCKEITVPSLSIIGPVMQLFEAYARRCEQRPLLSKGMIGEMIVLGELKLRDGADLEEYNGLGERMYGIVSRSLRMRTGPRPYEPGSVWPHSGSGLDASRADDRDISIGVRGSVDWTSPCNGACPEPAGTS